MKANIVIVAVNILRCCRVTHCSSLLPSAFHIPQTNTILYINTWYLLFYCVYDIILMAYVKMLWFLWIRWLIVFKHWIGIPRKPIAVYNNTRDLMPTSVFFQYQVCMWYTGLYIGNTHTYKDKPKRNKKNQSNKTNKQLLVSVIYK